jgi:rfaE bifunctional protein kinase chain/domain
VIGNHQHLLRVDEEQTNAISLDEEKELISKVGGLLASADGLIFEDYNKGVLTAQVIRSCVELSKQHKVFTAVDPKKDNFFEFEQVDLFKPNLKELKEGLGVNFDFRSEKEAFLEAVQELENRLNNRISLITLSEHGVFFKEGNEFKFSPAHIRNISDVSGAGDTVIAVATLAMVSGMGIELASKLANLAGGLVCEKIGVVPIDKDQLRSEGERLM